MTPFIGLLHLGTADIHALCDLVRFVNSAPFPCIDLVHALVNLDESLSLALNYLAIWIVYLATFFVFLLSLLEILTFTLSPSYFYLSTVFHLDVCSAFTLTMFLTVLFFEITFPFTQSFSSNLFFLLLVWNFMKKLISIHFIKDASYDLLHFSSDLIHP